jgi:predicted membrane protein
MENLNLELCPPAIIYLIFSLTQVVIDLYQGLYNTAAVKVIILIFVTFLLNILCKRGLTVVSWIIVFIPFILMTVMVSIILYIFGLNVATGTISSPTKKTASNTKNSSKTSSQKETNLSPSQELEDSWGSSSPAYQS